MYSTRLIHLFLVALSVFTVTQATFFKFGFIGKSINEVVARADVDATTSSADSTTSKTTSVSTTQKSSTIVSTTTSDPPTSTTSTSTPASVPATSTSAPQTSATTAPSSTDGPSITSDPATSATDSSFSISVSTSWVVITSIDGSGQTTQISSAALFTQSASLDQAGSTSSSGMPTATKNIIIGVCVGVGGFIILAVIGIMIWRLRHKRNQDENEELVNYGAGTSQFNSGPEKSEASGSTSGRSPFQSTLESYHAPSSNAGTNF